MAGAGVGTALTAAQLAPKLLRDPQRWGAEYDRYMKQLLPIQDTFDYFALSPREEYEPEALHRFSDRFVVTNLVRLAGVRRGCASSRLATMASARAGVAVQAARQPFASTAPCWRVDRQRRSVG